MDITGVITALLVGFIYPIILDNRKSIGKLREEIGEIRGKVEMLIKYLNHKKKR